MSLDDGGRGRGITGAAVVAYGIVAFGIILILGYVYLVFTTIANLPKERLDSAQSPFTGPSPADVFLSKFHVIVGLPSAAIGAFLVVAILRQTAGPIEFKGFGFEFRGASGPVILWMLCFLSIATMIKWMW